MTANPLMQRQPSRPGKVSLDMLEDLVASLNRTRWVRETNKPYFVARRVDEGEITHYLDRR